jgi:tetratricopeptide (TPR) repeat protein
VWAELGEALLDRAGASGEWDDVLAAEAALLRSLGIQETQEAFRTMARLRVHQHRFEEAETWARRALAAWPEDAAAGSALLDALLARGRTAEACALHEEPAGASPGFHALAGRARCRFHRGDLPGAHAGLEAALVALEPLGDEPGARAARAWCHLLGGSWRFEAEDAPGALDAYERALSLGPDDLDALEHRAEWEATHGDPVAAERRYAAIASRTTRPDLRLAWAESLLALGREEEGRRVVAEAEAAFRRRLAAGDLGARRGLALLLLDHDGDPAEALALAEADFADRPDAFGHDTLAFALHRAGRVEEARATLRAAGPEALLWRVVREHARVIAGP